MGVSVFEILTVFHSVRMRYEVRETISSGTGAVPIVTAKRKALITLEGGWLDNN